MHSSKLGAIRSQISAMLRATQILDNRPVRDPDLLYPPLRKRSRRGFCGYPVATVAFYGPNNSTASKVAVGIARAKDAAITELRRWTVTDGDIRRDPVVLDEVPTFIKRAGAVSVVVSDGILGCPHEEGTDYPEGQSCPLCPYWRNRDRFTAELIS